MFESPNSPIGKLGRASCVIYVDVDWPGVGLAKGLAVALQRKRSVHAKSDKPPLSFAVAVSIGEVKIIAF